MSKYEHAISFQLVEDTKSFWQAERIERQNKEKYKTEQTDKEGQNEIKK